MTGITNTSNNFTGLIPGTSYTVTVAGINKAGTGESSTVTFHVPILIVYQEIHLLVSLCLSQHSIAFGGYLASCLFYMNNYYMLCIERSVLSFSMIVGINKEIYGFTVLCTSII